MSCQAARYNDQMICDACGLQWDVYENDIPECNPKAPPKWGKPQLPMFVGNEDFLSTETPTLGLFRYQGGGYVLIERPCETVDLKYVGERRRRYTFYREDGIVIKQVQVEAECPVKRYQRTPYGQGRIWLNSWSPL